MFIKSLSYINHHEGWEIEKTEFTEFNLLVGASGVGKTQILRAIREIQGIAFGLSLSGVEWEIEFDIYNEYTYAWKGLFEIAPETNSTISSVSDNKEKEFILTKELLQKNETDFLKRENNNLEFENESIPLKLSNKHSLLSLFSETKEIQDLHYNLRQIHYFNPIQEQLTVLSDIQKANEPDWEKFINSNIPIFPVKSIVAEQYFPIAFNQIKARYLDIFSQVEDIRFLKNTNNAYEFQIKERDIEKWISQRYISLGMFTTFWHLCTIYLSAPGSVILIDEIENSLGVNCLPDIIEDMKDADRNLQFIVTSHHPYVINDIPVSDWKIVTRRNGKISVHPAEEFDIGHSRHKAFTQLINLPQYRTGNYDGHSNAR